MPPITARLATLLCCAIAAMAFGAFATKAVANAAAATHQAEQAGWW